MTSDPVFRPRRNRIRRLNTGGIPLRAVIPNTVTALALCSGLTAIRFAILGNWEAAVLMVLAAAVLDGIDGGIARLVRAESRFGAVRSRISLRGRRDVDGIRARSGHVGRRCIRISAAGAQTGE